VSAYIKISLVFTYERYYIIHILLITVYFPVFRKIISIIKKKNNFMHFINGVRDNMLDHTVYGIAFEQFQKSNSKFTIKVGVGTPI